MKNKNGISLIVLIITIIVVIILAAVVILTLSKNNPIESAKEAAFKEDIRAYQDELNMYITKEYQMLAGQRDSKITATGYEKDSTSEAYNNSIYKYLSSFKKKYENKIAIENDEIVYIGRDKKEREWTNNIVKMNAILTVKYVYENGEEAAPTYEETVTDGAYEVDSPIIDGYEPDHYTVSDTINKDTEITVTYYPWSEGLAYEELEDGTYTVSGIGTFAGENLVIPKMYNNINITQIKNGAFLDNTVLKTVIITESIKVIDGGAFQGCRNVKSINIDASTIKSYYSFGFMPSLEKVELGKNVKKINVLAFKNSNKLYNLKIYTEEADINSYMFEGCTALKKIDVNNDNNKYTSIDGVLYSKDKKKIYMCPPGKENNFIIPDYVQEIGETAFHSNNYLTKIEIPDTVKTVGGGAFNSCNNIEELIVKAEKIKPYYAFSIKKLKKINISKSVLEIGPRTFNGCNQITEVKYEGTIDEWNNINKYEWNYGTNITKVICSDGEVDI